MSMTSPSTTGMSCEFTAADQHAADSGSGEDRLDHDGARDGRADRPAREGHGGQHRVPQHVAAAGLPVSPIPRVRALSTNGWSSARSNSVRVACPMNPASGIANVSAGSTRPIAPVPPMTGNQPQPEREHEQQDDAEPVVRQARRRGCR